jgi:hypothetical protein
VTTHAQHARRACAAAAAGLALSAVGPAVAADAARAGAIPGPVVGGRLYDVAAASASDVWAVGLGDNGSLIMHCRLNPLWGVAVIGRDDAWAVGSTDYETTLILHWNGTSWS